MTEVEKKFLSFYIQDFKHEINIINHNFDTDINPEFFVTEKDRRVSFFEYAGKHFSFFADPILSLSEESIKGENLFVRRNGISFYGYVLSNWAYSLNFYDNEETGNNLDIIKDLTPQRGTSVTKIKENVFEYDFATHLLDIIGVTEHKFG